MDRVTLPACDGVSTKQLLDRYQGHGYPGLKMICRFSLLTVFGLLMATGASAATDLHKSSLVGGCQGELKEGKYLPRDARVRSIQVRSTWVVEAIKFNYVLNGRSASLVWGPDGSNWSRPEILPVGTKLKAISGRYGMYLDAIRFHYTNGRTSDYFGGEGGDIEFKIPIPQKDGNPIGDIVGFHGKWGAWIDAIGLVIRPEN